MPTQRTIAIVGATGAQGGALARAILKDPGSGFTVRGLTRDTSSEKARELADMGAEMVAADLGDPASIEAAFAGAWGAYCVTFFWEHFSPDEELSQAKAMAQAAKKAHLEHVVWSTLEDTRQFIPLDDPSMPTLLGKYKVPHFDAKGEADSFFIRSGVPATLLLTSFYWENFIYFGLGPQRMPDGGYAITFPMGDKRLPGISTTDIGKCAFGLFKRRDEFAGKTVGIAGEHLTGTEMAEAFSRALEQEVRYQDVPPDVYRSFGFPGADDLGNMFQFKRDFNDAFCGARSVDFSRSLNPELLTFEDWLSANRHLLKLESASAVTR